MPTNFESKPNGHAGNGEARSTNGSAAHGVLGGIQQRVSSQVDQQKNRAADGLGGIADVFRTASNELRTENETLASYVDMASDQMRRFAEQIRQRGAADMLEDVNAFARRQPALFIGGAFLLGVAIARFLKSSAERPPVRSYGSDFSSVDPMTSPYTGDAGAGPY
jgi:hypothetical protein